MSCIHLEIELLFARILRVEPEIMFSGGNCSIKIIKSTIQIWLKLTFSRFII